MSLEIKNAKRMTTRSKTNQLLQQQQQQEQQQHQHQHQQQLQQHQHQQQQQQLQQQEEVSSTTVILPDVDDLTGVCGDDSLLAVDVSSPLLSTSAFGSSDPIANGKGDPLLSSTALSSASDELLEDKINEPVIVNEIKCTPNSTPNSAATSGSVIGKTSSNSSSSSLTSTSLSSLSSSTGSTGCSSILSNRPHQPQQIQQQQLHLITTTTTSATAVVVNGRVVSLTNSTSNANVLSTQNKVVSNATTTSPATGSTVTATTATTTKTITANCNSNSNSTNSNTNQQGPSTKGRVKSSEASGSKAGGDHNSFAAADSNSGNPPSKSIVLCKVCGDKASGYHYGVTSCEGCKGFFRRSIQKQIEYRCLRDGKCMVIRLNRNRCQYCRFKKCLAVGMSRDSVRYGRVPKRSRERGGSSSSTSSVSGSEENRVSTSVSSSDHGGTSSPEIIAKSDSTSLAIYDIILTISQAHHAHCSYTEEKTRGLIRKPAIFSLDEYGSTGATVTGSSSNGLSDGSPSSVTADSLEHQKIVMWQQFAVLITPSIQRVVEFAKRIPGFLDLTQDDQLILIKVGFFEIWLVHISRMANSIENTLTFSDGSFITKQQMELMFDYEFVSAIFNFMLAFNALQLNDTEIGLFAALVLLQSERPGIYDTKAIDRGQERLMEALKIQLDRNHPSESQIYPILMTNVAELRSLGLKHAEHLSWFRSNWNRLMLPPLFAEIFDIPKGPEDENFIPVHSYN